MSRCFHEAAASRLDSAIASVAIMALQGWASPEVRCVLFKYAPFVECSLHVARGVRRRPWLAKIMN